MMTIGVSELQKNISIIRNLKESLQVVDRKTNEVLATILPANRKGTTTLTEQLAGSMANGIVVDDIDKAYHEAKEKELLEKYGKMNEE